MKSECKTMSVTAELLRILVSIIWRTQDKTVDKYITIIQKIPKIIIEKEMLKIKMQKIRCVFNNMQCYSFNLFIFGFQLAQLVKFLIVV